MQEFLVYTVLGLTIGAVYAVAACGLVVTYTTSGIFNFAHGAMGMLAAFTYWQLTYGWGVPIVLALALVLFVIAPLFGALIEFVIMRGLAETNETVRIVVSVSLLSSLIGVALWIWRPNVPRPFPMFFAGDKVKIFGAPVTVHQLISMGCAVLIAIALGALLRGTRIGIDMRAVVDSRPLLMMNGGTPDRVAMFSWSLGSMLAALAGILIAPTLQLSVVPLTLLVVNAYAAAVIGRLRSLPLTFVGALIIGLAESYGVGYLPMNTQWIRGIRPAIPVIILFVALLLVPHARPRGHLTRAREWFPVARRNQLAFGCSLIILAGFLLGPRLSTANLFTVNRALALGIIVLSMVPLIGFANQISLCQMSFAAIGALAMAWFGKGGNPLGLVAAFFCAAALGAIVALPTLRLRGIYLALATGAFAVMLDRWVFALPKIHPFGMTVELFGIGGVDVARLHVGPVAFESSESQLVLLSIVFVLIALAVVAVRRSSYGRMLLAMRESEAACATLGLRLTLTKLGVFAFSAGIAGIGGALLGGVYGNATPNYFTFFSGLQVLLLGVIGGIGSVSGAFIGVVLLGLFEWLGRTYKSFTDFLYVLPGLAGIGLARNPGGIASDISNAYLALTQRRRRGRVASDAAAANLVRSTR